MYKFTRCFMEPAKQPGSGRHASVVRTTDVHGDPLLTEEDKKSGAYYIKDNDVIEIFDGKEFNLDDEQDAAWWEAIRFSRKIAQDRWERDAKGNLIVDGNAKKYGTAEFYVERPGLESRQRNTKKRLIHEAKEYIYKDSESGLIQKTRLLGNEMSGLPVSDVEDYLVGLAEKAPEKITQLYTGTDTHLRLFLLDSVDKDVIYNRDGLYYYGDNIVLGATDQAVIQYFKNPANKRLVDLIKDQVYPEYAANESQTIDQLTEADMAPVEPKSKTTTKK